MAHQPPPDPADGSLCAAPTPIVRVPANGPERTEWIVKQVLDYGAFGIVLPHVQSADDVRALVACARYAQGPGAAGPDGHRGVWPDLAPRYWGSVTFEDYVRQADLWPLARHGEMLLLALVEDRQGFDSIAEITEVEGLGGVLFGPGDGLMSLGGRGAWDIDAPALRAARREVARVCREAGVPAGFIGATDGQVGELAGEGFSFFVVAGESASASRSALATA
jgi:4-hydroxy-2-oxoheptanedioate aldolase